jgi:hypothetical protein
MYCFIKQFTCSLTCLLFVYHLTVKWDNCIYFFQSPHDDGASSIYLLEAARGSHAVGTVNANTQQVNAQSGVMKSIVRLTVHCYYMQYSSVS